MKAAIMQPYFLPYIGYFQLIGAVDVFIIYDNIKYTKKGWINRNRYLLNGSEAIFSIPLAKDSDFLEIRQRKIAHDFERRKLFQQIAGAYRRAPHADVGLALLETILDCDDQNLFEFISRCISRVSEYLGLETPIVVSSTLPIDHTLQSQDKVIALCEAVGANAYVNPIGGMELYSSDAFAAHGLDLTFLRSSAFEYKQFENQFVPWLSILDLLMFNPLPDVRDRIAHGYELVSQ